MLNTPDTSPITLYTSLPPKLSRKANGIEIGEDYQRECISSWRSFGFDIISLNSRSEIESLSRLNYGMGFIETASAPPKIADFVEAIKGSGAATAAIINADVLIVANQGIMQAALAAARSAMVIGERINIDPADLRPTGASCIGFDFFAFSTEPLSRMDFDGSVAIGGTWWDYLFPLQYHQAGGKLLSLPSPILLHLDHTTAHTDEAWLVNARKTHSLVRQASELREQSQISNLAYTAIPTRIELRKLAPLCYGWLANATEKVAFDNHSSILLSALLKNVDEVSNISRKLSFARSHPVKNLRKYVKWRYSNWLASVSEGISGEFAARMKRRAKKNAPVT
jgi:hypothetical protein